MASPHVKVLWKLSTFIISITTVVVVNHASQEIHSLNASSITVRIAMQGPSSVDGWAASVGFTAVVEYTIARERERAVEWNAVWYTQLYNVIVYNSKIIIEY